MIRVDEQERLYAVLQRARLDYQTLTAEYDEELLAAHNAAHGTDEFLEHLKKANAMGPEVRDALQRYQVAVARMQDFYSKK